MDQNTPQNTKPSNEIKVGFETRVGNVVRYCNGLLNEQKIRELHFSAIGGAVGKLVSAVEVLKLVNAGLYQRTNISNISYSQGGNQEGKGGEEKLYPKIEVTLSLDDFKDKGKGYQGKLDEKERLRLNELLNQRRGNREEGERGGRGRGFRGGDRGGRGFRGGRGGRGEGYTPRGGRGDGYTPRGRGGYQPRGRGGYGGESEGYQPRGGRGDGYNPRGRGGYQSRGGDDREFRGGRGQSSRGGSRGYSSGRGSENFRGNSDRGFQQRGGQRGTR